MEDPVISRAELEPDTGTGILESSRNISKNKV
jgi:hypothetical protein